MRRQNQDKNQEVIQKLDAQIKRIDDIVEQLLDGVDISELSARDRLSMASRLLGLSQRGLKIKATHSIDETDNRQVAMMTSLMEYMRGETVDTLDSAIDLLPPNEEEL